MQIVCGRKLAGRRNTSESVAGRLKGPSARAISFLVSPPPPAANAQRVDARHLAAANGHQSCLHWPLPSPQCKLLFFARHLRERQAVGAICFQLRVFRQDEDEDETEKAKKRTRFLCGSFAHTDSRVQFGRNSSFLSSDSRRKRRRLSCVPLGKAHEKLAPN